MKIALIQAEIFWQNPQANRMQYDKMLEQIDADLIIFPEMFTTGFTMDAATYAEDMQGASIKWLKKMALRCNSALMGSLPIQEEGNYKNRLIMTYPCSSVSWYDKRHLFTMGQENQNYSPGSHRNIFNYQGWRIMPQICYDLRFPVWSRNNQAYDLLVYVANWPASRSDVWRSLLKARAIENQSYVVGVNCVGTDGQGIEYQGDSVIYDAKGRELLHMKDQKGYAIIELSLEELEEFRKVFPVLEDADNFELQ